MPGAPSEPGHSFPARGALLLFMLVLFKGLPRSRLVSPPLASCLRAAREAPRTHCEVGSKESDVQTETQQ
eukprot:6110989-Alexandrium_andersonii.AAC.1